jgi:hypothetical protein
MLSEFGLHLQQNVHRIIRVHFGNILQLADLMDEPG